MVTSRHVLPIPDRVPPGHIAYDARDPESRFAPIGTLAPPAGAPNILVMLLDDVGFGASSAFGGPVYTPTAERLAAGGLRYTRFHTTGLCGPTRAALLTGRNHHSVGMGGLTEGATSAPGYTSVRTNDKATLPETLRLNGYATAQFGKCHEVPVWETGPAGPFDRWPTGTGFEHFYGFLGGTTDQYHPALYDGTTAVEPDRAPGDGYHFTEDMTNRSIAWVRQQKALQPDRPFFVYWTPAATHAPHHVPGHWADRYRGRFDDGWDAVRDRTFARQKELGVLPADAELTGRPAEIPAWDGMDEALKPVLRRQMEVYAGYLEHTDRQLGRLIDALGGLGVLDDTLVYLILGDAGASAEGGPRGTANETIAVNGFGDLETPEFLRERIGALGGPGADNHYAVGWAYAMGTPYRWTKQVASHFGGTRVGTVVYWPHGIGSRGELRHQFHHVIDVAPTVLEVAGLPQPTQVHGVTQAPVEGVSMEYSFNDANAPGRRTTQYFEMLGNRGIYHEGWMAVTRHRTPWVVTGETVPYDEDVWEVYDTGSDWTQARDLAHDEPDRLVELQRLWLIEATRYGVLPLDDRVAERFNPDAAGRPTLVRGDTQTLYPGMGHLNDSSVLNVRNRSYAVTAEVEVPDGGAEGVLIVQGGAGGGWSLYLVEGRPRYCYNLLGVQRFYVGSDRTVPPGTHQVRVEFGYDGGGLGKGGTVSLYLDGDTVGEGRVEATQPLVFALDETTDVGRDTGSAVTPEYDASDNSFTGRINWIQLDVGKDDHDHLVPPAHRYRIATARH
jgi:arylsulfatase